MNEQIKDNRSRFLDALRSGKYHKGPYVKGQDRPPSGATGYCAIGLPAALFGFNKNIIAEMKSKLGIGREDVYKIQNDWNDSSLTFPQIADMIEYEIFSDAPKDNNHE